MERRDQKTQDKMDYDISIIRTQMRIEDFQMRGQGMSLARLKGIKIYNLINNFFFLD